MYTYMYHIYITYMYVYVYMYLTIYNTEIQFVFQYLLKFDKS